MTIKDFFILLVAMLLTSALTLFVGYKYLNNKTEPESIETAEARIQQRMQAQVTAKVIDSLRTAGNQTITKIQKIYIESKKEIPLIMDADSLENSVNELEKTL